MLNEKNPYSANYYAVTLNAEDSKQYYGSANRVAQYRSFLNDLLLQLDADYYFKVEVSTPIGDIHASNKGPRLHAHGVIRLNKPSRLKKWLINGMPLLLVNNKMNIDKIIDGSQWLEYIHKDDKWMNEPPLTNWSDPEDFLRKVRSIVPSEAKEEE